ncbi:hypothetical protein [Crocosphaera sp. Alani8]|uniref:hypothetical protein n=1 Tax=Crocosphaera sp. Alani8 TaxID=3038952 RepID=UPI00313CA49D
MIQTPDLSIVKEKVILMAQANEGQLMSPHGTGNDWKVVSYFPGTFSQMSFQHGDCIKFFINPNTGGIS